MSADDIELRDSLAQHRNPEAAPTAEICLKCRGTGDRFGRVCFTCKGEGELMFAPPAAEVSFNKVDEAFASHLEREGYWLQHTDASTDYPQKFATFRAGAEWGYDQRPDVAALKAVVEAMRVSSATVRSGDSASDILDEFIVRIEAACKNHTEEAPGLVATCTNCGLTVEPWNPCREGFDHEWKAAVGPVVN